MIKYEFTYNYDPAFAVSINREFLWNRYGGLTISFFLVGLVAIIGLLTGSYRGFWSFCLGMASLYCFYLVQMAKQLYSLKKSMPTKQVKVVLDESGCAFETDISRGWLSWSSIKRARRLKSGILLERADGSYTITIPYRALTEDASRFLDQSIKQAKLINVNSSSISK